MSLSNCCEVKNCKNPALFAFKKQRKTTHCAIHKLDDMVQKKLTFCIHPGCQKKAMYDKIHKNQIYCIIHKFKNMESNESNKCFYKNCKQSPTHGFNFPTHCKSHKLCKMRSFEPNSKKCTNCNNLAKYENYCYRCFINKNPNSKLSILHNLKVEQIIEIFRKEIRCPIHLEYNSIIINLKTNILFIEIDENRSPQNGRLLYELNKIPIFFILINPQLNNFTLFKEFIIEAIDRTSFEENNYFLSFQ